MERVAARGTRSKSLEIGQDLKPTEDDFRHDRFLSHASEDKADFVVPLARELSRLGVKVWFDRFSIKVGDSLSRSIEEGLSASRFGILVLSRAFLSKPWPEYELRGLVAR